MHFKEYKFLVVSDLCRVVGNVSIGKFIKKVLFGEGAFKYVFWMRTCSYARKQILLKYMFFPISRLMLRHLTYRLGISIPYNTVIGSGFYIGHFGGIVVHEKSIIGKNCNISHGVTLGQANRGKNKGYPMIGDNVYIGSGAKIIGSVKVGNNVAIGANCVVTKDIPDDSVVVGIPAKVISQKGSGDYINRTDYEDKIEK